MKFRSLAIAALLSACSSPAPISSNPAQDVNATVAAVAPQLSATLSQGLQDAAFNLDSAIQIGVLDKTDPADSCVHGVLQQAGIETVAGAPPTQSFTPKISDAISLGSVLYIRAHQAKGLAGQSLSRLVPAGCQKIVGAIIIDGLQNLNKAGIAGAGAIIGLPLLL